uniref:Protein kinase domain-containing protein n=1 Tax=Panagrellus redivivus TaxID=6233 RepID=A0A7E4UUG2_PANRE
MASEIEDDDGRPIKEGSILVSARAKYLVHTLLGAGGFGAVFKVRDMQSGEDFAMKIEKKLEKRKHSKLKMEVAILKMVSNERENSHFVQIVDRAKKEKFFFLVMTLVGKSLDDLKKEQPEKVFSVGTGIGSAMQCLEAVEDLHKYGFIHRDLKPANYAIGTADKIRTVYILDFGIARKYLKDESTVKAPRVTVGFKGTIRFASLACHNNRELGPKDDVESWLYLLVDLIQISGLPWRRLSDRNAVKKVKEECRGDRRGELLQDLECKEELSTIMEYIDNLSYSDKIDYNFIYDTLKLAAKICKVDLEDPYDWEVPKKPAGQ